MSNTQKIIEGIRQLTHKPYELVSGTVVPGSVDADEYTCSIRLTHMDDTDTPLANVMLSAVTENGNGVIRIPADGSNVIIGSVGGRGQYFLVHCSNLAKVLVTIGDTTCQVDGDGVVFNRGSNGGLPVTAGVVQRLNAIEDDINKLKMAFSNWVVTPNDGGAKLKLSAAAWTAGSLTQTQNSDIENTKIKQ